MNVISVRGDIWVMTGFKMYLSVNFFLNQRRHANETVNSNQVELGWNGNLWKWRRKKNKEDRDNDWKLGNVVCL